MVRVLVVEDEANIREMIALNLRLTGMEAVEAESAEAALRAAHCFSAHNYSPGNSLFFAVLLGFRHIVYFITIVDVIQ